MFDERTAGAPSEPSRLRIILRMLLLSLTCIGIQLAVASTFAAPADQGKGSITWRLLNKDDTILVRSGGDVDAYDLRLSCHAGTGEIEVRRFLWAPYNPDNLDQRGGRINETVVDRIASGPIVRQYAFRRVYDSDKQAITQEMDMMAQADDPLWREFARSGRLSLTESPRDARTPEERRAVSTFMRTCGRRFPLKGIGPTRVVALKPKGDGDLAYPFTGYSLTLLSVATALLAAASFVGGSRLARWGTWLGVIVFALLATLTAGPFSATLDDGWVLAFNEMFVPAASAFGQLVAVWLVLAVAGSGVGLGLRGLFKVGNRSR